MARLVTVSGSISVICFTLAVIAIWGIERRYIEQGQSDAEKPAHSFIEAIRDVWSEPEARRMTLFVFISMLAFSAQELLLEPFAGSVFGLTPGETAKLFGTHRSGIVLGMVLGAVVGSLSRKAQRPAGSGSQGAASRPPSACFRWPGSVSAGWRLS